MMCQKKSHHLQKVDASRIGRNAVLNLRKHLAGGIEDKPCQRAHTYNRQLAWSPDPIGNQTFLRLLPFCIEPEPHTKKPAAYATGFLWRKIQD